MKRGHFGRWGGVAAGVLAQLAASGQVGPTPIPVAGVAPEKCESLECKMRDADLAFRGTVVDIQYKLADRAAADAKQYPFTFVTFSVDDVLAGADPGPLVTLRFIGGLDDQRMRFLRVSTVPHFDLGDEDILFVRGNGVQQSPLVDNIKGRLRVIDGQVFTDGGRAVKLSATGELEIGAKHRLPDVMTSRIAGGWELPIRRPAQSAIDGPADAVWADELAAVAKQTARGVARERSFVNADIAAPLVGPEMRPAPPPDPKPGELEEAAAKIVAEPPTQRADDAKQP